MLLEAMLHANIRHPHVVQTYKHMTRALPPCGQC
jgi:hypothetical protein